jgi:hypothetical protein
MSSTSSTARARVFFSLAALVAVACSKTPEPPPAATAAAPGPERGAAPSSRSSASTAAEVGWEAPGGWQKAENPSPMRKATYKIPRAAGDAEDGELSVSQAGGSVDLNIKRWAGQFEVKPEDVKRTDRSSGGLKITVVELHGTFTGMAMPGVAGPGARPGFALLGAIVETTTPTFFKLTGPEKTVMAARSDFDKLVESLRAK